MQHGDLVLEVGKAGAETVNGLRREGNLRNEHEGGLAALESLACRLQINFGLARSGHAVKQNRGGLIIEHRVQGQLLLGIQGEFRIGEDFFDSVGLGIAPDVFIRHADEALGDEGFDGRGGSLSKLGEGEFLFGSGLKKGEDGVLFGGTFGGGFEGFGVRVWRRGDDFVGFGGVLFGAHRAGQKCTNDTFNTAPVVVSDPSAQLKQLGGDERLGVAEFMQRAERIIRLGMRIDGEHRAGGIFMAKRNAHATPGDDGQAVWDLVIKDEFRGTID